MGRHNSLVNTRRMDDCWQCRYLMARSSYISRTAIGCAKAHSILDIYKCVNHERKCNECENMLDKA